MLAGRFRISVLRAGRLQSGLGQRFSGMAKAGASRKKVGPEARPGCTGLIHVLGCRMIGFLKIVTQ